MKKSIVYLVPLLTWFPAATQQLEPGTEEYHELLKKSQVQKTIATSSAVAGGALMVTGGLIYLAHSTDGLDKSEASAARTGEVLFLTGAGLALVSTLFWEPSRKQRFTKAFPVVPFVKMTRSQKIPLIRFSKSSCASFGFRFGF